MMNLPVSQAGNNAVVDRSMVEDSATIDQGNGEVPLIQECRVIIEWSGASDG